METTQVIEHIRNAPIAPFTLEGSLWVFWFILGIALLWFDLSRKVQVGFLSVAAFIAVFASFYVPLSSQSLVFAFFATAFIAGKCVHKAHQKKTKHIFVH